jgi:hypothetical protein
MKATISMILSLAVAAGLAMAAKSLAVKDLPPAVQKTVQEQTKAPRSRIFPKRPRRASLSTKWRPW